MRSRDLVLEALEQHRGEYLSGEALAQKLFISRNAVWKAIGQLQEQGHAISAVPRRGYCLAFDSQPLSPPGIGKYLTTAGLSLEVRQSVTSTNTLLRQMAQEGAPEGTVLLAEEQTAGRGRRNKSFSSPPGGGIYMSVLLRPRLLAQEALYITTAAAVAVCQAVEDLCGVSTSIKWVNDVFCHGKKICGISTEASLDLESGGLHYAVLGMGINVFPGTKPFSKEAEAVAATIFSSSAATPPEIRARLAAGILDRFFALYPHLSEKAYFEDYRRRCFLLGQPIHILQGDTKTPARALSLTEDFGLVAEFPDGRQEILQSGEVSIRGSE